MVILFRASKQGIQYQVGIQTYNKESKVPNNTLSYDCYVLQKRETLKGYIVNFGRSNVSLNNTAIHTPLNEIALIMGELLHDLDLEISAYGEILSIKNIKEIYRKWEFIKYKILNTYLGETVELIVDDMDKKVHDMDIFISMLYKDAFFYYFFQPYIDYTNYNKVKFDDKTYNFAGVPELTTSHRLTLTQTDKKEKHIVGKAVLGRESLDYLQQKRNCESVDFNLSYSYCLTSENYIEENQCSQDLLINGEVMQTFQLNINTAQK